METDDLSSTEIPCFKCLLWDERETRLSCNPNTCQELTEWLLKQVEKYSLKIGKLKQTVDRLKVLERASAT